MLLSDTTFVLFVIDQGSGTQAEGLCAHEFIGAPSSSAPQVPGDSDFCACAERTRDHDRSLLVTTVTDKSQLVLLLP